MNDGATQPSTYAELANWMRDEARGRRERIEHEMRASIEAIRREAEGEERETLAGGRADFDDLGRRIRVEATTRTEREADASVLRVVAEGVDRVMVECEQRLRELAASDAFSPLLERLLLEAVDASRRVRRQDASPEEIGDVSVAPADAPACRAILSRHHLQGTVLETPSVWGGVELRHAGTPYVIRNTLLSRFRKQEESLRRMAAERLTGAVDEETVA